MIEVHPDSAASIIFINKKPGHVTMADANFMVLNVKRTDSASISSSDSMNMTIESHLFEGGKFNNTLSPGCSYKARVAEMSPVGNASPDQPAYVFKFFPTGENRADRLGGTKLFIRSIALFSNREAAEAYAAGPVEKPITFTSRMQNGMGEVDLLKIARGGFPDVTLEQTLNLIRAMNIGSYRLGMHLTGILDNPDTLRTFPNSGEDPGKEYKDIIKMLKKSGVELIVGLCHSWFLPDGNGGIATESCAVPLIDYTPGSDYMLFLDMFRRSWKTMAGAFPEIQYWQIANETNNDGFLHKRQRNRHQAGGLYFTEREKAATTLDMMYYATQGILEGNPVANVVMLGMAPIEGGTVHGAMSRFLNSLYDGIEAGMTASGSSNPNEYFQVLAWHPYTFGDIPDRVWVAENQRLYTIGTKRHGQDLPVFLTEFGFTHSGSSESIQRANDKRYADYLRTAFRLIRDEMNFVTSVMLFRQYEETSLADKGEAYYGLFRIANGHITPNDKGRAVCTIYGGDESKNGLLRYAGVD